MTDASKTIIWDRVQDPFGNTHSLTGAAQNPLRFPGQYADEESALAYNYFRDYDSTLGRYVQSDPIGLEGGLGVYLYVAGNPLRFTDPDGLKYFGPNGPPSSDPWGIVGAEIGAFVGGGPLLFTCKDNCGVVHRYLYMKFCYGGYITAGVSMGAPFGPNATCAPDRLVGHSDEFGGSIGPVTIEAGGGATDRHSPMNTDVFTGEVGIGVGLPFKAVHCYYWLVAEW